MRPPTCRTPLVARASRWPAFPGLASGRVEECKFVVVRALDPGVPSCDQSGLDVWFAFCEGLVAVGDPGDEHVEGCVEETQFYRDVVRSSPCSTCIPLRSLPDAALVDDGDAVSEEECL
jgi:hypothetical protein